MPALLVPQISNDDELSPEEIQRRKIARAELEAARAERVEVLGPHLELLDRLKASLPADSPDCLAIDALAFLVKMTPVEQAKSSALRARWEVCKKPLVVANQLKAMPAA